MPELMMPLCTLRCRSSRCCPICCGNSSPAESHFCRLPPLGFQGALFTVFLFPESISYPLQDLQETFSFSRETVFTLLTRDVSRYHQRLEPEPSMCAWKRGAGLPTTGRGNPCMKGTLSCLAGQGTKCIACNAQVCKMQGRSGKRQGIDYQTQSRTIAQAESSQCHSQCC